jgi:hypothetical protein
VLLAFALPFMMFEAKKLDMAISFAPLGLMFFLIAWPREPRDQTEAVAANLTPSSMAG